MEPIGYLILFKQICGAVLDIEQTSPILQSTDGRINKMKIFSVMIICLLPILGCAKENDGAYQFVSNLYTNYRSDSTILAFVFNGPRADTIFSQELLKLIRLDAKLANGENGYLDEDPLCSCQDPGGLKVDKITITKKNGISYAEVKINFSRSRPIVKKTIVLQLKEIKEKWLIDDVVDSSSSNPSLFKFLAKSLAKNNPDTTK
jgi:Protein of unknown function (DUF3828)